MTINERRINRAYKKVNSMKPSKRIKEKKNKEYCTPYRDLSCIQQIEIRLKLADEGKTKLRPDQIRKIKIRLIELESGLIKEKRFKESINNILREQFYI